MFQKMIAAYKEAQFRQQFSSAVSHFEYELSRQTRKEKSRLRKKGKQKSFEPHIERSLECLELTKKIHKIAYRKEQANTLAHLLYSETILMKKLTKALQEDGMTLEDLIIQDGIYEVRDALKQALEQFHSMQSESLREELMITRELKKQREQLKIEWERQKSLSSPVEKGAGDEDESGKNDRM